MAFRTNTNKTRVINISDKADDESSDSDLDKDFATETTCHGISHWYTSKNKWQCGLWVLLVLGFTSVLTYQVTLRIQTYYTYATSTDISDEFVAYLVFPAVTICSFNRYFINATGGQLQGIYALNQLSTASQLAFANNNDGRSDHDALSGFGNNFNISNFLKDYGFSISSQYMPRCTYKTDRCSESNFTSVATSLGRCYTFNGGNTSRTQNIPGAGNGLGMILDIRQYLYTEQPLEGIVEAGIKIQVHPQYEEPDVETYGVSVPAGQKVFIEMTRTDNELMYKPWGKCEPDRESLVYFPTYSLNNCMNECYTNAVVEQCGCRLNTQYWDTVHDECTTQLVFDCAAEHLLSVKQNYSADDCNCSIPCSFTQYDLSTAYATFPGYTTSNFLMESKNLTDEYIKENLVKIEVYFQRMSYKTFSQSKKVDESGLLSDVGGQLGLWAGMSFITIFEFLQYFVLKSGHCIRRSRKRKSNGVAERS